MREYVTNGQLDLLKSYQNNCNVILGHKNMALRYCIRNSSVKTAGRLLIRTKHDKPRRSSCVDDGGVPPCPPCPAANRPPCIRKEQPNLYEVEVTCKGPPPSQAPPCPCEPPSGGKNCTNYMNVKTPKKMAIKCKTEDQQPSDTPELLVDKTIFDTYGGGVWGNDGHNYRARTGVPLPKINKKLNVNAYCAPNQGNYLNPCANKPTVKINIIHQQKKGALSKLMDNLGLDKKTLNSFNKINTLKTKSNKYGKTSQTDKCAKSSNKMAACGSQTDECKKNSDKVITCPSQTHKCAKSSDKMTACGSQTDKSGKSSANMEICATESEKCKTGVSVVTPGATQCNDIEKSKYTLADIANVSEKCAKLVASITGSAGEVEKCRQSDNNKTETISEFKKCEKNDANIKSIAKKSGNCKKSGGCKKPNNTKNKKCGQSITNTSAGAGSGKSNMKAGSKEWCTRPAPMKPGPPRCKPQTLADRIMNNDKRDYHTITMNNPKSWD